MRAIIDRLVDEFHERTLPDLMPRSRKLLRVPGKASVVVGMRRSGKTWFCYQDMQKLLSQGVDKTQLLFLNFEDERLMPFESGDFQEILETYYRKFPSLKDKQCYLYLDEAQRIEGWERFVRRVLDTERLSVCLTGSSSKLLSTEIATSLRGRAITTEIFPFSFPEFLRFHHPELGVPERFGARTRAVVQQAFSSYLTKGGFPEVQKIDEELRRQVLRSYVDVVVLRDVVERYRISNVVALRALIRALLTAPATRFSVNKFYNTLRSQGISCAKNDLYAFLAYLQDAYLIHSVPVHSRSEKARQVNPRKVYAEDPGLLEAMSLRMTQDHGAVLENMVYLHLRGRGIRPEYYVTRSGFEVDFVVIQDRGAKGTLIQSCWSLEDPETRAREIRGLQEAMSELGFSEGAIVTWLDEEVPDKQPGIAIIPAWKWLLGGARKQNLTVA